MLDDGTVVFALKTEAAKPTGERKQYVLLDGGGLLLITDEISTGFYGQPAGDGLSAYPVADRGPTCSQC